MKAVPTAKPTTSSFGVKTGLSAASAALLGLAVAYHQLQSGVSLDEGGAHLPTMHKRQIGRLDWRALAEQASAQGLKGPVEVLAALGRSAEPVVLDKCQVGEQRLLCGSHIARPVISWGFVVVRHPSTTIGTQLEGQRLDSTKGNILTLSIRVGLDFPHSHFFSMRQSADQRSTSTAWCQAPARGPKKADAALG